MGLRIVLVQLALLALLWYVLSNVLLGVKNVLGGVGL